MRTSHAEDKKDAKGAGSEGRSASQLWCELLLFIISCISGGLSIFGAIGFWYYRYNESLFRLFLTSFGFIFLYSLYLLFRKPVSALSFKSKLRNAIVAVCFIMAAIVISDNLYAFGPLWQGIKSLIIFYTPFWGIMNPVIIVFTLIAGIVGAFIKIDPRKRLRMYRYLTCIVLLIYLIWGYADVDYHFTGGTGQRVLDRFCSQFIHPIKPGGSIEQYRSVVNLDAAQGIILAWPRKTGNVAPKFENALHLGVCMLSPTLIQEEPIFEDRCNPNNVADSIDEIVMNKAAKVNLEHMLRIIRPGMTFPFGSMSHAKGTVTGMVYDRSNRKGMANVKIRLVGTNTKVHTHDDGYFELKDIEPGWLFLEFKKRGYELESRTLFVRKEKPVHSALQIPMSLRTECFDFDRWADHIANMLYDRIKANTYKGIRIGFLVIDKLLNSFPGNDHIAKELEHHLSAIIKRHESDIDIVPVEKKLKKILKASAGKPLIDHKTDKYDPTSYLPFGYDEWIDAGVVVRIEPGQQGKCATVVDAYAVDQMIYMVSLSFSSCVQRDSLLKYLRSLPLLVEFMVITWEKLKRIDKSLPLDMVKGREQEYAYRVTIEQINRFLRTMNQDPFYRYRLPNRNEIIACEELDQLLYSTLSSATMVAVEHEGGIRRFSIKEERIGAPYPEKGHTELAVILVREPRSQDYSSQF